MTDHRTYRSEKDLPQTMAIFPLGGALLLPRARLPLNIFEPRYLAMIDDALAHHRLVGMVQPKREGDPAIKPELYSNGCAGRITSFNETNDGRYMITLSGICRFRIEEELQSMTPYRQAAITFEPYIADLFPAPDEAKVDREHLLTVLRNYLDRFQLEADWESINQAPMETLVNSLSMICPFELGEKQALLEAESLAERAKALIALIEMATVATDDDDSGRPLN